MGSCSLHTMMMYGTSEVALSCVIAWLRDHLYIWKRDTNGFLGTKWVFETPNLQAGVILSGKKLILQIISSSLIWIHTFDSYRIRTTDCQFIRAYHEQHSREDLQSTIQKNSQETCEPQPSSMMGGSGPSQIGWRWSMEANVLSSRFHRRQRAYTTDDYTDRKWGQL
jgi:hypothetical protein